MRECNAIAAIIGAFLLLNCGSLAGGAEVPFTDDFSSGAPDFNFSSSSANVVAILGDALLIDSALGTGSHSMNALVDISNADGIPIVIKTEIMPIDFLANGGHSTGFMAFTTNPDAGVFPSGPNSGYLADVVIATSGTGFIRLIDFASGITTITDSSATPFPAGSIAVNETYQLIFNATPRMDGFLDLSLTLVDTLGTLIDDDGIVTISATTPAAASTGTYFGYRHRVGNNGTGANRRFDAMYDNFSIGLAPDPGDYNGDGSVDAADYVMWRKSPGGFGGNPEGYDAWRANFGNAPGSGSSLGENSAVPEPATCALFTAALVLALVRQQFR